MQLVVAEMAMQMTNFHVTDFREDGFDVMFPEINTRINDQRLKRLPVSFEDAEFLDYCHRLHLTHAEGQRVIDPEVLSSDKNALGRLGDGSVHESV